MVRTKAVRVLTFDSAHEILHAQSVCGSLALRVRPPGIERKMGRNRKWGDKKTREIGNGPGPEMGQNGPKNGGEKSKKRTPNPIFVMPLKGKFSPILGRGPFRFFGHFFPVFGFRPVFHCMPGGLSHSTCNSSVPSPQLRREFIAVLC